MSGMDPLPELVALRYVQPLREGGSLPAVVDTDDGLFVVKFRGAGQGAKVLVAELVVGMIARAIGLPVPDMAIVAIPGVFGRSEPDPEIRAILTKSHGVNVALRYLDGAFNFDLNAAGHLVNADLAARIVWLDALVSNPDRTARNTNLLVHQRKLWLIDHGAALYTHFDWHSSDDSRARGEFPLIRDHVLLTHAADPLSVDDELAATLSHDTLGEILARVPTQLLEDDAFLADGDSPAAVRDRYVHYLDTRLRPPRAFVTYASEMRRGRMQEPPQRRHARR